MYGVIMDKQDFVGSKHCKSGMHCQTCRNKVDGREWRKSLMNAFKLPNDDVDFECTVKSSLRPWGWVKPEVGDGYRLLLYGIDDVPNDCVLAKDGDVWSDGFWKLYKSNDIWTIYSDVSDLVMVSFESSMLPPLGEYICGSRSGDTDCSSITAVISK